MGRLRVSEATYLEESDVHLENHYVKVLGKRWEGEGRGFQGGLSAVHPPLLSPLPCSPTHIGVSTFFLTIDGYPLSPEAIKSYFRRLSESARIPQ